MLLKIDRYWSKNKRGEDGLKIDAIHLKIDHRIQYRYVLLIIGLPSSRIYRIWDSANPTGNILCVTQLYRNNSRPSVLRASYSLIVYNISLSQNENIPGTVRIVLQTSYEHTAYPASDTNNRIHIGYLVFSQHLKITLLTYMTESNRI